MITDTDKHGLWRLCPAPIQWKRKSVFGTIQQEYVYEQQKTKYLVELHDGIKNKLLSFTRRGNHSVTRIVSCWQDGSLKLDRILDEFRKLPPWKQLKVRLVGYSLASVCFDYNNVY